MIEILKWLLLPLLGAAGWFLRRFYPRFGCAFNEKAALALFALWGIVGAAGIFGAPERLHRPLAQLLIGSTWLVTPFVIGSLVQGAIAKQENRGLGAAGVVFLVLVSILLTAATGYMGPSHASGGGSLAFAILHLMIMPGVSGAGLLLWAFMARREGLDQAG